MRLPRSAPMPKTTLEKEQAAFEALLDDLLAAHKGEFALFKGGKPLGFFPTHEQAYEAGLDQLGLDAEFLVARVEEPKAQPISVSWSAGVMFGQR